MQKKYYHTYVDDSAQSKSNKYQLIIFILFEHIHEPRQQITLNHQLEIKTLHYKLFLFIFTNSNINYNHS